jgi:hypothetical protein
MRRVPHPEPPNNGKVLGMLVAGVLVLGVCVWLRVTDEPPPIPVVVPAYVGCDTPYLAVPGEPCLEPTNLLFHPLHGVAVCGCVQGEALQAPSGFGRGRGSAM